MEAHLAEISTAVDPGAHAVVIVDQAGWHISPKLNIPDNITLLPLPPQSAQGGARAEPCRERLAVHARQLVVEPDLHILRRHRRALLRSLEQAHRPALEDHVHRHARLGAWVLINARWYDCQNRIVRAKLLASDISFASLESDINRFGNPY